MRHIRVTLTERHSHILATRAFVAFFFLLLCFLFLAPGVQAEEIRDFSVGIEINKDGTMEVEETPKNSYLASGSTSSPARGESTGQGIESYESIKDYDVEIVINKSGTIEVEEKIQYDFGSLWRHGIFREIPFIKRNQGNKKYKLDFAFLGVEDENGQGYKFEESKRDEKIRLKIGDPDKKITGVHTYIIKYRVAGALTYFSDHDELYWNITGNEWDVPIKHAKAEIRLPTVVQLDSINVECFTGKYGGAGKNCLSSKTPKGILFETNSSLFGREGMTVVVGWPKGIVGVLEPELYKTFWETVLGRVIIGIGVLVGLFWYLFYPIRIIYKWFKYGRDPEVGAPVRAWFDPPKSKTGRTLTPGEVGTLVDETAQLKDISAILTDLARRGFFRIEERKNPKVRLPRSGGLQPRTPEGRDFWAGNDFYFVKRRDWKDSELLDFEKELLKGLFKSKDEVRLKNKRLYSTVVKVKQLLYEDLVKEGLFPKNPDSIRKHYATMGVLGLFTLNIQLALVAFTFGRLMPQKTEFGAEAARIAGSLKNFLASQERQIAFAVEKGQKQVMFEKLLPYAVAFGVEKIWAKRFEGFDMREPEWYRGYHSAGSGRAGYSSAVLVNSLGRSFSRVASAASPPSSTTSSSGFSSGFSGGFSGGGGGGGGGGSW